MLATGLVVTTGRQRIGKTSFNTALIVNDARRFETLRIEEQRKFIEQLMFDDRRSYKNVKCPRTCYFSRDEIYLDVSARRETLHMDVSDVIETENLICFGKKYPPVEPVFMSIFQEIFDAIAIGCTLQKPRRFNGRLMNATDFVRVADNFTYAKLCKVTDALYKNSDIIQNRIWYILGICSKI